MVAETKIKYVKVFLLEEKEREAVLIGLIRHVQGDRKNE